MKSKKGALALSMNTIIIIIIGVTVLSLGLLFVRNIFQQVESLSKTAFETADAELGEISSVDEELTVVPQNIEVKKGSAETVDVILANFETIPITIHAIASSTNTKIDCSFADTMQQTSKNYLLESGQQATLTLIIDEKNGPLGTSVCNLEIISPDVTFPDPYAEIVITIVKK